MATPYPSPLPTPAWIQANEAVVGENSPLALADVANRPAKTIMTSLQQVATFIEQGGANQFTTLDSLLDVTVPTPTSGDYLKWNGSAWINSAISGTTTALAALTDTSISAPAPGDILSYSGTVWINTKTLTGSYRINGMLGFGAAPDSSVGIYMPLGFVLSGSVFQYGCTIFPTFNSSATSRGETISAMVVTQAASFTMAVGIGLYVYDATKGAGSTITTLYGLKVENQTRGATNYAIHTGTGWVRHGDHVVVQGAGVVRFENTWAANPSIATGPGLDMGLSGGVYWLSGYNRTSSAGIAVALLGSDVSLANTDGVTRFRARSTLGNVRVEYSPTVYYDIIVSSAGVVTLTATGSGASIYLASPTTITSTLGIQNTVTITQGTVNTLGLTITGSSTTGSSAVGLVSISHTWNTSGIPTLIDVNVTNIASGSDSKIINLRFGSNSVFLVGTLGVVQLGRADSSTAYVGMTISSSGLFTITPNGTTAYGFLSGPGWTVGSTLDIVGGVLIMAASAIIKIGNSGSASNPAITTLNRESTGIFIDFSSPNALGISYLGTEFARFYGTTTDDMGIMLQDITGASLKQVKRGAADSGGSGYRLLKVAN